MMEGVEESAFQPSMYSSTRRWRMRIDTKSSEMQPLWEFPAVEERENERGGGRERKKLVTCSLRIKKIHFENRLDDVRNDVVKSQTIVR